jgi:L-aspartate oxidase
MMSRQVGVLRDGENLASALAYLRGIDRDPDAPHELKSMATAGLLIAAGAWRRNESRGSHKRLDYPKVDPRLKRRTFLSLDEARRIADQAVVRAIEGVT